jgi:hypothetical protein
MMMVMARFSYTKIILHAPCQITLNLVPPLYSLAPWLLQLAPDLSESESLEAMMVLF